MEATDQDQQVADRNETLDELVRLWKRARDGGVPAEHAADIVDMLVRIHQDEQYIAHPDGRVTRVDEEPMPPVDVQPLPNHHMVEDRNGNLWDLSPEALRGFDLGRTWELLKKAYSLGAEGLTRETLDGLWSDVLEGRA